MINLRVLVPEATVNYIQNPSIGSAGTGWLQIGGGVFPVVSKDYARFGTTSLKVACPGNEEEGVYYRVNSLQGIRDVVTVSAYLRGDVGDEKVRIRLYDGGLSGGQWTSDVIELRADRWKRVEMTGRTSGSNDIRLVVVTAQLKPYTFYIDGGQMELKAYSTSYCDGDQPGCRWNLAENASNSSRSADTREGGRWIPLAGPCRPNNDIYVTVLGGFGDPPVQNNIQSWATAPGSFYQNQKILDRVVTLNFTVKKERLRDIGAPSLVNIHNFRQQLVDLFKTDKTLNDEAFWFEYSDTLADKPLYIRMRYEAGLEGSWDVRNPWFNTFAVRLIAVDPMWSEDSYEVKQIGISETYTSASPMDLWGKVNNVWTKIGGSSIPTAAVYTIVEGPDGSIYIGGDFTNSGLNRTAKWDGNTLTPLGVGATDAVVRSMAFGPDGMLYAVGNFTTIGGVAATRVAKYNPSTNTWSALGTGFNSAAYAVVVANNGVVYAGGNFTTAGGVNCYYMARWDGFQWRPVGITSGLNNIVFALAKSRDGNTIYAGGVFTNNYGVAGTAYGIVASLDTTTNLFSAMGTGLVAVVTGISCMAVGIDGTVYAGGDFVVNGSAQACLYTAQWNGGNLWSQVGSQMGVTTLSMTIGSKGELYASVSTSLLYPNNLNKYYGGVWTPIETNLGATAALSMLQHSNGDLYVGFQAGAPYISVAPKITTITNPGTASCWPILTVVGSGTLRYISNIKTGQEIFLNLPIFTSEEIQIDFAKGTIVSNVRGALPSAILPGSEIRSIQLLPGDNQIALYVAKDVGATAQIGFKPMDWSADAIINAKALE